MKIRWTKLTDQTHRFEVTREDGSGESVELETRSLLLHDLVHYAVEAQAGLRAGFYGSLASGATLASLQHDGFPPAGTDLATAESLVGPMQSLFREHTTRTSYLEHAAARFPDLVDDAFVDGVLERLRQLTGHWKATPYGSPLELTWPAEGD